MNTVFQAFAETAETDPDRAFLCVPPASPLADGVTRREWSYRAAAEAVDRLARHYQAAGYGLGHRVALLLPTSPQFVFHYLALNALGVSAVPVNPDYRADELSWLLDHTRADLLIATERHRALIDGIGLDRVLYDEALPPAFPPPVLPAQPGEAEISSEAAILYTSGTTGRPKGCVLDNRYFLNAGAWNLSFGGRLAPSPDGDRLITPLPLFHMTTLAVGLTSTILSASCLILIDRFHPMRWWQDCVDTGATRMVYLGIMPPLLMKMPASPLDRAHRITIAAGAGIDPVLHGAFEERFGFPLLEVWGMTETGRILVALDEPRGIDTRAFGRPRPGLEVRVVDDRDCDVPLGQPGELIVRHSAEAPRHGFFRHYLDDAAATEEAWRQGWFHSGDIVRQDATGMLSFVDRKKNIIRRSGENIAATEIETALIAHPAVLGVGVTAAADELRDEEVAAFIVLRPEVPANAATARDLFDWVYARLAYYKAPGWIAFRAALPTTGTQKVKKTELLAPGSRLTASDDVFDLRAAKKPSP